MIFWVRNWGRVHLGRSSPCDLGGVTHSAVFNLWLGWKVRGGLPNVYCSSICPLHPCSLAHHSVVKPSFFTVMEAGFLKQEANAARPFRAWTGKSQSVTSPASCWLNEVINQVKRWTETALADRCPVMHICGWCGRKLMPILGTNGKSTCL